MQNFSKSEALKFGWGKMKANFWTLFLILVIAWLLPSLVSWLANRVQDGLAALIYLLMMAAQIIISIGLIKISLKLVDGQKAEVADLFSGGNFFFRYLITAILVNLIVLGGAILLIVPGIIWAIKYQFASYLIVDKGLGIREAIRRSGEITQGAKWNLFIFGLLAALINIAGFIVFGVGLFATVPTIMIASAFIYRKLSGEAPVLVPAQEISVPLASAPPVNAAPTVPPAI